MQVKHGRPDCEGVLETPDRKTITSHLQESFDDFPGEVKIVNPSGSCSMPPLFRRPTGVVTARWSMNIVVAIPKPIGGHQR